MTIAMTFLASAIFQRFPVSIPRTSHYLPVFPCGSDLCGSALPPFLPLIPSANGLSSGIRTCTNLPPALPLPPPAPSTVRRELPSQCPRLPTARPPARPPPDRQKTRSLGAHEAISRPRGATAAARRQVMGKVGRERRCRVARSQWLVVQWSVVSDQ